MSAEPYAKITHPRELMDRNTRTLAALLDALAEIGAPHALIGGLVAGYYGGERRWTWICWCRSAS